MTASTNAPPDDAPAYLLTWNPERYANEEFSALVEQARRDGDVHTRWSTGRRTNLPEGSRVFLLRQGSEPRGIVASGHTERDAYTAEHWEEPEREANYVDVVFDHLVDPTNHPDRVLSIGSVEDGPLANVHWTTQSSGIEISPTARRELEHRWRHHLATVDDLEQNPWDPFITWARRFYRLDSFDEEERQYKLRIADNVRQARSAVLGDAPDWHAAVKRAFGSPNNLTSWRMHADYIEWAEENPDEARAGLLGMWRDAERREERVAAFLERLPSDVVSGTGTRLNLATFFLMAVNPERYPIYRPTPFRNAYDLTEYGRPDDRRDELAMHQHALAFIDRLMDEATARGLELRDRLDAQGVLWCVTKWPPPEEWSVAEQHQFLSYRKQSPSDGEGPLRSAFSEFRSQRLEGLRVRLLRQRTDQIRELFSDDTPPDLETFMDEFWRWHNRCGAFLEGEDVTEIVFDREEIEPEMLDTLEQALSDGRLSYRGFYHIIGGVTTSFRIGDTDEERAASIEKVWRILNSDDLSPLEKAEQAEAVHGLGRRKATGLTMAFHPTGIAPWTASHRVLTELGYPAGDLKPYERAMATVADVLGAQDMVELEWFLRQVAAGTYDVGLEGHMETAGEQVANDYAAPPFDEIRVVIRERGLRIRRDDLRRYHMALQTRGFVILSGISGTGKTWLAELYATVVGARHRLVAVAPNWTSNEDLLGYHNPLDGVYHHTPFSRFLQDAQAEWHDAERAGRRAQPYHLILDEMNLARVEYYFARFLSAIEVRAREGTARLELAPDETVDLTPNLVFVGTINVDETTHGFADKVSDRAQLIELTAPRDMLEAHLDGKPWQDTVLEVWDAVSTVAPFAFRALDEIEAYVEAGRDFEEVEWQQLVDEQINQKILPRFKGTELHTQAALEQLVDLSADQLPRTHARAIRMLEQFQQHGLVSYF